MSACNEHKWAHHALPCPDCLIENAPRPPRVGVVELGVRIDVFNFSLAMEAALRKHDEERGERGWMDSPNSIRWFIARLKDEVKELDEAAEDLDREEVKKECADVANFAMIIYSILTAREGSS